MINGQTGEKKGGKIINSVVDAIIDPKNQFQFSWTGRSSAGSKTKVAFNEYKEIISVIHAVCRLADSSYSRKECEQDLTYKVFKYANAKRSKDTLKTVVSSKDKFMPANQIEKETIFSTVTENSLMSNNCQRLEPSLENQINNNALTKLLQLMNESIVKLK